MLQYTQQNPIKKAGGIIVVAVITSVIVNFYNEVKDERTDRNHPESKE